VLITLKGADTGSKSGSNGCADKFLWFFLEVFGGFSPVFGFNFHSDLIGQDQDLDHNLA